MIHRTSLTKKSLEYFSIESQKEKVFFLFGSEYPLDKATVKATTVNSGVMGLISFPWE